MKIILAKHALTMTAAPSYPANSSNVTHELPLDDENNSINLIFPPVLIIMGNVFNILAILVMRTRNFQSLSTSVYMIAGAVNDATSLLILLPPHWLFVNYPGTIVRTKYSHWICKFFNFYGWGNCDFSIIVTAAMTADRAYAILYPLKSSSCDMIKKAKITIPILALVVTAKEFHFWFTSDIVESGRKDRMCDVVSPSETYHYFYFKVWPWLHLGFLTACFIVIIISNMFIIRSVKLAAKQTTFRKSFGGRDRQTVKKQTMKFHSQWRQITFMLLAESFTLLLLTYPFSVHLAVSMQLVDKLTKDQQAVSAFVFSVSFYLLYSNKCVNFCLYCLTGSRFRKALREILCCKHLRFPSIENLISRTHKLEITCSDSGFHDITPSESYVKKEENEMEMERF